MIELATPLALAALPLPLIVRRLLRARPSGAAALKVPATLISAGDGSAAASVNRAARVNLVAAAIAWILLVAALAGPQRLMPSAALPMTGREIMLVLDFSGSMERKDFTLDGTTVRRIDALKAVAAEFLSRRSGDKVGLVLFAEEPQLAAVPTFDLAAVNAVLQDTEIGTLGRSTAIGDGLGLALKRLDQSSSPSRVVILLSDGTSTAGAVSAPAAAALAKSLGVRVHTIALGTDDALSDAGAASLVDAATLEKIAAASGGKAFRVRSTEDLRAVTTEIETLEAARTAAAPVSIAEALWIYPAAAALIACLVGFMAGRRLA